MKWASGLKQEDKPSAQRTPERQIRLLPRQLHSLPIQSLHYTHSLPYTPIPANDQPFHLKNATSVFIRCLKGDSHYSKSGRNDCTPQQKIPNNRPPPITEATKSMQNQETGFNRYSPEVSERDSVTSQRESSPEVIDTEGQTLTQAIRHSQPIHTSHKSSSSSEKSFLPDAQEEDPFRAPSRSETPEPLTPDLGHVLVGHQSGEERLPPVTPATPTPLHRPHLRRNQSKPLSESSLSPPVGSPFSGAQRTPLQPPTAVKQTPTIAIANLQFQSEAAEMSQINVPEFSGASDEDSARWCRLLECAFVPVRRQYTQEAGMSEDEAKCYILLSKTQGAARKWINEQDDEMMRDWEMLKEAFTKRFPKMPKKGKTKDALSGLYGLKQNKRDLDEYFEEAREIYNSLPKELAEDVAERVIDGLDNETVRGIVGGILGETTADFERVVTTIRGVVRQRGKKEDPAVKKEDERLLGLSSTDKVLLGVLQQNSTLMENFTKSFATMSLDANRRREMAPVHNIARQAGEGISRDLNRNAPEREIRGSNWTAPGNQPRRGDYTTAGGSKGTYYTGQRPTMTCWNCGIAGHGAQGCTNPPLPAQEQDRLRNEFFTRRAAREKDTTPATGTNSTPLGQSSKSTIGQTQQPIGVHQVEETDDDIEQVRQCQANQAEAFRFGSPFHRPTLEDWDVGDEDTLFKETYQCEHCSDGEEAMALGDKRSTVEYEEDDAEATHAANRTGPRKVRRVSSNEITFAPESSSASKRPAVNPRSREALQTLQPPIQKTRAKPTTKRGAPPELKPRGMQDQNPWDAGNFLRTTKLDVTLAQFLHFSPKARAGLAEAIRLQPNPRRTSQKATRFADPLEIPDEEMSMVEDAFMVARNDDYIGAIEPFGVPPPNKRKKCTTCGRHHYSADNKTKYFPMPELPQTSPQLQIKGNFYTTAFINARKSIEEQWKVNNCLIDPGATINLISERIARKINCVFHDDTSLAIRSANGATDRLPGYTNLKITVASVPKILRLYVVPGKVSYNMILGRPWLRMTSAIGLYAADQYWIKDSNDIHHRVQYVGPSEVQTPEVYIAEDLEVLNKGIADILQLGLNGLDEETIRDLELAQEQQTDDMLQQIIEDSNEEQWDEYDDQFETEETIGLEQEESGNENRLL